jgi:hypothetical protein
MLRDMFNASFLFKDALPYSMLAILEIHQFFGDVHLITIKKSDAQCNALLVFT